MARMTENALKVRGRDRGGSASISPDQQDLLEKESTFW